MMLNGVVWIKTAWRPYESLYSLVNVFAAFNVIERWRIGDLLYAKQRLNCLVSDDQAAWATTFRCALDLPHEAGRELALPESNKRKLEADYCDHLRFCPRCLSVGYHSELFQLNSLKRCPIHESELTWLCSSCGQHQMVRRLSLRGVAFSCPACGYLNVDEKDVVQEQRRRAKAIKKNGNDNFYDPIEAQGQAIQLLLRRFSVSGDLALVGGRQALPSKLHCDPMRLSDLCELSILGPKAELCFEDQIWRTNEKLLPIKSNRQLTLLETVKAEIQTMRNEHQMHDKSPDFDMHVEAWIRWIEELDFDAQARAWTKWVLSQPLAEMVWPEFENSENSCLIAYLLKLYVRRVFDVSDRRVDPRLFDCLPTRLPRPVPLVLIIREGERYRLRYWRLERSS